MTANEYIIRRLEAIQSEIATLKRLLSSETGHSGNVTLEGLWEGAEVTDEDIEEAKRSLFKPAYDDDL